jgi:hypothetical protein
LAGWLPDEKDLARWAVAQILEFGGVLEHPSASRLWEDQRLGTLSAPDEYGGWTLPIHQHWFGHRAEKSTLLYIVGCAPADVPQMPIVLGESPCVISTSGRRADGSRSKRRPEVKKDEREHTPIQLAEWLIKLARLCVREGEPA